MKKPISFSTQISVYYTESIKMTFLYIFSRVQYKLYIFGKLSSRFLNFIFLRKTWLVHFFKNEDFYFSEFRRKKINPRKWTEKLFFAFFLIFFLTDRRHIILTFRFPRSEKKLIEINIAIAICLDIY
jgi:hypothetical protein